MVSLVYLCYIPGGSLRTSMSTELFIIAVRGFIARRGRISTIYSDKGTTFAGCNNLVKNIDWNGIKLIFQASHSRLVGWMVRADSEGFCNTKFR